MAVFPQTQTSTDDLLPWLRSIKKALDEYNSNTETRSQLDDLLQQCITKFKDDDRFLNDIRFLKIWILYADSIQDFESVFRILEEKNSSLCHSDLYISYAVYLELKGKLIEANDVYRMGISRNAQPIAELKGFYSEFLKRMDEIENACLLRKIDNRESAENFIDPWSKSTIGDLLRKMKHQLSKYKGYHVSTKAYSGKEPLASLKRNKIIELGGKKYLIKGRSGKGGFAQVFKACLTTNPDDVVALKIQKPAFPWEFYIYRQLDKRISDEKRSSFAYAHRVHIYSDYSILVCDYLPDGTLQDAINSYVVKGQSMEEVLCIYYSIDMLHMLESLHSVGIIHGDFKPDNLLVRYARDDLTEVGFSGRTGPWHDQGLWLIDWGRGIDLSLFPEGTLFTGDCRTSGFRCLEIQEHRPWKFQVDTYGLCVIVHMMLHGSFMAVKNVSFEGKEVYQPTLPLKRYWNVNLWSTLFTRLLNATSGDDHIKLLESLRKSFEDYLTSNPQLIKKLTELLRKQRATLCSN